jgi:hypothetical protein
VDGIVRGFSLVLYPPFLFLLPEVFTDDVWVGQVEVRGLEDEVRTPNSEQPADPSEDQPWVDIRVFPVCVWWAGVGKGSLEGPEVTVRRRDQVGFVGSHDDGGRDGGTENDEDSEYRGGSFDPVPHYGLSKRWPEEKEEEHGTEDGSGVYASKDGESSSANDIVIE